MTNVIVAQHQYGIFARENCETKDCGMEIRERAQENHQALYKYADILRKLIELSQVIDGGRFMVERYGDGPLKIWSAGRRWSASSANLEEFWLKGKKGEEYPSACSPTETIGMGAQDMYT